MRSTMKFSVEKVVNGCRLGKVTHLKTDSAKEIATPMCLLYTKSGSVPMLTRDMVDRLPNISPLVHYSLPLIADSHEAVGQFGSGLTQFTGLRGFMSYISVQDPAIRVQSGYNDKHGTAVWGRGGKVKLDVELFLHCQEAFQPDFYQALCDADTDKTSSRKRAIKSLDRTLNFLDKIIDRHNQAEKLKDCGIFGCVVGGYHEEERVKSAKETSKRPVSGFTIEGFHNFGPETEDFSVQDISGILKKTLAVLPDDKPRLMHGVWRPDQILHAIHIGIDIFDSSYPYLVAERGSALVFDYDIKQNKAKKNNDEAESEISQVPEDKSTSTADEAASSNTVKPFEINLQDKKYFDDFGPLLADCECYTCQNYSRSYISHLLNTSELLAGTLLTIHNFHHYFGFFGAIRDAIQTDKLEDLTSLIHSQRT